MCKFRVKIIVFVFAQILAKITIIIMVLTVFCILVLFPVFFYKFHFKSSQFCFLQCFFHFFNTKNLCFLSKSFPVGAFLMHLGSLGTKISTVTEGNFFCFLKSPCERHLRRRCLLCEAHRPQRSRGPCCRPSSPPWCESSLPGNHWPTPPQLPSRHHGTPPASWNPASEGKGWPGETFCVTHVQEKQML